MKKLFIYYSYTGNGDVIAQELENQGFEIRKVIRQKRLPKSFFWGVLCGGFLASIAHKDKLQNYDKDISGFEKVVIGSPIWNARLSSPINRVLADVELSNIELTFVLYAGSGTGKKAVKRINKQYPNAKVVLLKDPKKYPEELKKISEL